ncbi:hypothetical protein [Candidatus Hodarchaeum mangrovi]
MDELKLSKYSWQRDMYNILQFFLKLIFICFLISLGIYIWLLINNELVFSVGNFLSDFVGLIGGVCVLIGFLVIVFTGCVNQQARTVVTIQAGRMRTPNPNQFSQDFMKRQLDDWVKTIGGVILLILGFGILVIIYRLSS